MKIAITSDLHLKTKDKTPERYQTLKEILMYLQRNSISTLILAGDTFDKDTSNPSDLETLCNAFSSVQVILLRGNHDANIQQTLFVNKNIKIVEQPTWYPLSNNMDALMLPFENKTMDEVLLSKEKEIIQRTKSWILIGHGTFFSNIALQSELSCTYEKDSYSYMPLSRKTLEKFRPEYVFLGHTHKPFEEDGVISPGTPYPLDSSETGKRRFIIFDATSREYESIPIDTDVIYLNETFFIIPSFDHNNSNAEINLLKSQWNEIVKKHNLSNSELEKVILTAHLKGWTANRQHTEQATRNYFLEQIKIKELHLNVENLYQMDRQTLSNNYEQHFINNLFNKIDDFAQNSTFCELTDLIKIKVCDMVFKK